MTMHQSESRIKSKILVVDDDPDIAMVLKDRLDSLGYETIVAKDGAQALDAVERETPRLMILDLEMPRLSGLEALQRLSQGKQRGRDGYDVPVIVMTAHGTIKKAVEAMREGAYDFVTKPIDLDHLIITIQKASEREALKRHYEVLRTEVGTKYATIIGTSPQMKSMIELAQRAAGSDASVLLLGESGTGKELFARSIHQWSPRRAAPFVVINCVALTETLLENELFGHEKGAFTGADRLEKGKIEMADGGTIFLDEIGDMPPGLQAKLLRILQDQRLETSREDGGISRRPVFSPQCCYPDASAASGAASRRGATRGILPKAACGRCEESADEIHGRCDDDPHAVSLAGQYPGTGQQHRACGDSESHG
jgi:DNA-binding NtrC family response regulator